MGKKIYGVLNVFFRLILIFFIAFIWIRYYTQNLSHSIYLTIFVTVLVELFIRLITGKKNKKTQLKLSELTKMEQYINTFIFNDDKFVLNFFYELAKSKHNATKKVDFVLIEHDNNEKIVLYPFFTYRSFSTDDLILILNKTKSYSPTKIVLCVNKADKEVFKFSNMIATKILILEKEDVYLKLIKAYEYYPKEKDLINLSEKQKNKIKQLLLFSLTQKRSKGYFISSLLLMLSCLIVPYNIYYLTFSSILLVLSLLSLLSPLFLKKTPEKII